MSDEMKKEKPKKKAIVKPAVIKIQKEPKQEEYVNARFFLPCKDKKEMELCKEMEIKLCKEFGLVSCSGGSYQVYLDTDGEVKHATTMEYTMSLCRSDVAKLKKILKEFKKDLGEKTLHLDFGKAEFDLI